MSLIFLAASCNLEPKLLYFLSTATSVAWMVFKFLLKIKHKQYIKTTLRVWLVLIEGRKSKVKASHCICTLPPMAVAFPPHLLCCHWPLTFQRNQWSVKIQESRCIVNTPTWKGRHHSHGQGFAWLSRDPGVVFNFQNPHAGGPSSPGGTRDGVRSLNSELDGFAGYKSGP